MNIDLTTLNLPHGWTRRDLSDGLRVIEAEDPAEPLTVPLRVTGLHTLRLDFLTPANRRDLSMQLKLSLQQVWRRIRPMRFIHDERDAIQSTDVITLDVQPGDALHIRTEPVNGIAIAGMSLTPAAAAATIPREKEIGFVHDTNMSFSKFTVREPEDVYSIIQPYIDSHVTHVFWGTGVGTYSPLYDSAVFGWHGQEQCEFMADHRERTAVFMRKLMKAGKDPLTLAIEYAHANGLQLWANHRISKNHEPDFRDDFPGGRFLIQHRDKLVLEYSGEPHFQTIVSHAYPEIRQTTVQCLVEQARYGVDGIYIDFLRKSPIVGWEEKSIEDFVIKHGFDPRQTQPKNFNLMWFEHLSTYPTMLLRELRNALELVERELGRRMPIAVNVKGNWRFTDGLTSCIYEGLDPFTWAKEGLVDIVIPGQDLWLDQECLDRYTHGLSETDCSLWGAIGPQVREMHRGRVEKEAFGAEYADTDPWRYLQAAHDYFSQGAPGVAIWESQDIPSVPQVWNIIKHRIGSHTELRKEFGDKLGRFDGSDKFERRFVTTS
jgi:hypothetical protein